MYLLLFLIIFISSSNTVISLFSSLSSTTSNSSYYLLNVDVNSNDSQSSSIICDNLFTEQQTYRIPRECLSHFYCDLSKCDEHQFRCVKLRESLCCLYKYFTKHCRLNTIKENFRYIYFQLSVQHGYCEINLERIENNDETYCIADEDNFRQPQTTTVFYPHYHHHHMKHHTQQTSEHHHLRILKTTKHYRRKQNIATRHNHSTNPHYLRKVLLYNPDAGAIINDTNRQTIRLMLFYPVFLSLLLSNSFT